MPRCWDAPLLVMGVSVSPVAISRLALVLREASLSVVCSCFNRTVSFGRSFPYSL